MGGGLPLEWLVPASLIGGLVLASITTGRIWITAVAISIVALVVGFMLHPTVIELGNGIAAFLSALAGGAVGSIIRRNRTT